MGTRIQFIDKLPQDDIVAKIEIPKESNQHTFEVEGDAYTFVREEDDGREFCKLYHNDSQKYFARFACDEPPTHLYFGQMDAVDGLDIATEVMGIPFQITSPPHTIGERDRASCWKETGKTNQSAYVKNPNAEISPEERWAYVEACPDTPVAYQQLIKLSKDLRASVELRLRAIDRLKWMDKSGNAVLDGHVAIFLDRNATTEQRHSAFEYFLGRTPSDRAAKLLTEALKRNQLQDHELAMQCFSHFLNHRRVGHAATIAVHLPIEIYAEQDLRELLSIASRAERTAFDIWKELKHDISQGEAPARRAEILFAQLLPRWEKQQFLFDGYDKRDDSVIRLLALSQEEDVSLATKRKAAKRLEMYGCLWEAQYILQSALQAPLPRGVSANPERIAEAYRAHALQQFEAAKTLFDDFDDREAAVRFMNIQAKDALLDIPFKRNIADYLIDLNDGYDFTGGQILLSIAKEGTPKEQLAALQTLAEMDKFFLETAPLARSRALKASADTKLQQGFAKVYLKLAKAYLNDAREFLRELYTVGDDTVKAFATDKLAEIIDVDVTPFGKQIGTTASVSFDSPDDDIDATFRPQFMHTMQIEEDSYHVFVDVDGKTVRIQFDNQDFAKFYCLKHPTKMYIGDFDDRHGRDLIFEVDGVYVKFAAPPSSKMIEELRDVDHSTFDEKIEPEFDAARKLFALGEHRAGVKLLFDIGMTNRYGTNIAKAAKELASAGQHRAAKRLCLSCLKRTEDFFSTKGVLACVEQAEDLELGSDIRWYYQKIMAMDTDAYWKRSYQEDVAEIKIKAVFQQLRNGSVGEAISGVLDLPPKLLLEDSPAPYAELVKCIMNTNLSSNAQYVLGHILSDDKEDATRKERAGKFLEQLHIQRTEALVSQADLLRKQWLKTPTAGEAMRESVSLYHQVIEDPNATPEGKLRACKGIYVVDTAYAVKHLIALASDDSRAYSAVKLRYEAAAFLEKKSKIFGAFQAYLGAAKCEKNGTILERVFALSKVYELRKVSDDLTTDDILDIAYSIIDAKSSQREDESGFRRSETLRLISLIVQSDQQRARFLALCRKLVNSNQTFLRSKAEDILTQYLKLEVQR
jgi:hypothetical protein